MKIRIAQVSGIPCMCLLLSGCATPPKPKPMVLSEIPVHSCSRTNWNTAATCMIYPMFGNEGHANANHFIGQLAAALRAEGYEVVGMDTVALRDLEKLAWRPRIFERDYL